MSHRNMAVAGLVGVAKIKAPTVTSVVPNNGPAAGGTAVVIHGTNFKKSANPAFAIGGVACTGVVVTSATTANAITGAHGAAGPLDTVLTNAAGGDGHGLTATGAATYTYT